MDTTNATLFERLRQRDNSHAWREFVDLYTPLLRRFARKRGLLPAAAEEVAQECLAKLVLVMPNFQYDRGRGSFKGFLFTIVRNAIAQHARRKKVRNARTAEWEGMAATSQEQTVAWDREWLRHHVEYCLRLIENELQESTVAAFRLYALKDWPVEKVCETLGLSANQVYLAKSRVMRRLREELSSRIGDV